MENWIWTENDFEAMYWNDCSIYTIEFDKYNHKLTFDIDYIFKWIEPKVKSENYGDFAAKCREVQFERL